MDPGLWSISCGSWIVKPGMWSLGLWSLGCEAWVMEPWIAGALVVDPGLWSLSCGS